MLGQVPLLCEACPAVLALEGHGGGMGLLVNLEVVRARVRRAALGTLVGLLARVLANVALEVVGAAKGGGAVAAMEELVARVALHVFEVGSGRGKLLGADVADVGLAQNFGRGQLQALPSWEGGLQLLNL